MTFFPPEFLNLIEPALPFLKEAWKIFKIWWWIFPPFLLWPFLKYIYHYWRKQLWDARIKKIVLEIKIPERVIKSIKAMEYAIAGFHAIHDVIAWREKWIEGQFQLPFSLEIVSLEGEPHFYIRVPEMFRKIIESNIYSQYPEAEISEVEDYTTKVPQDIPNKDWDLWGTDFENTKPDPYPLKTYLKFEREAEILEERMVDPLAGLLEGMATLGPGEQLWLQIFCKPIRDEKPWVKKGLEIRDKLAKRVTKKPVPKPMITEAIEVIVSGPPKPPLEEKELLFPPEMRLTPGEKDIVQAIEEKISKFGYDCCIRFIYLAKRDAFFKPRARLPFGFFKAVSSENLGGLKPEKTRMTKMKSIPFWFLDKRRVYLKKRKLFRNYYYRFTPLFPRLGGTYVLNSEELATLFHFPGRIVAPAPTVPRIGVKKGEAPPGLPVE